MSRCWPARRTRILDERVPLIRLPSLELYNDHFPMRKARIWEMKTRWDVAEAMSFNTGNFSEPMAFSMRAWDHLRQGVTHDFDLVHDNQCLGWGVLLMQMREVPRAVDDPPPDHGGPAPRDRARPHPLGGVRQAALVRLHQDADPGRQADAPGHDRLGVVGRRHRHRPPGGPGRIHVVPVGVDPDLFLPVPGYDGYPGRIVTTASADVVMKGLKYLLEAMAKLRTERHVELVIIGKPNGDSASTKACSRTWA